MNINWTPFLRLSVISLFLFIFCLLFSLFAPQYLVSKNLLFIVPFFYFSSVLSTIIYLRIAKTHTNRSKIYHLAISGTKLGIYFTILLLYGIFYKSDVAPFFISFLLFYFIYTYLDVKLSVRALSR
jgi:hypothetical protein